MSKLKGNKILNKKPEDNPFLNALLQKPEKENPFLMDILNPSTDAILNKNK